jgi:uncharacterized membrane protein
MSEAWSEPTARQRAWQHVRGRLMAGLALFAPLWITFAVVGLAFGIARDASLWIVEAVLGGPLGEPLLVALGVSIEAFRADGIAVLPAWLELVISLAAVVLTVCAVYALGAVSTRVAGQRLVGVGEALLGRLPFVATIYRASKQVLETLSGGTSQPYQRVVLVPYPSREVRTVGFVTRVVEDDAGHRTAMVFMATTPNPTTGYLFVVAEDELVDLPWSAEEAIQVVMSGGVILPSDVSALIRGPHGTAQLD